MPAVSYTNVYEILLRGVVLNQETINRFHYGTNGTPASMTEVAEAFDGVVAALVYLAINQNASFTQIDVNQIKGGNNFGSISISRQGTNGGDCLPPYAAYDFTLVRAGVGERNGYKRIAGVGEGNQTNGIANSGIISALNGAADAMARSMITTSLVELFPVILRTRVHKVPVTGVVTYSISNCIYSKIGTQNSRKFGHGR
jgi:hypothetical protein